MLDDTTALNMALAKIAELEIEFERQTMQVAKLKHLIAAVRQMDVRMAEVKAQRDDGINRIEELEGMLEKAQDHMACADARIKELEGERDAWRDGKLRQHESHVRQDADYINLRKALDYIARQCVSEEASQIARAALGAKDG